MYAESCDPFPASAGSVEKLVGGGDTVDIQFMGTGGHGRREVPSVSAGGDGNEHYLVRGLVVNGKARVEC